MVAEMNYSTVASVMEVWERIRRMDNYEEKVGTRLLQKLFTMEPEAKAMFGIPKEMDVTSSRALKEPQFIADAQRSTGMIDKAVNMLGPDIEMLTEILLELGEKANVSYGVKPQYYPSMGRALIDTISELLGPSFTTDMKSDWNEICGAMAYDMIRAQKLAAK